MEHLCAHLISNVSKKKNLRVYHLSSVHCHSTVALPWAVSLHRVTHNSLTSERYFFIKSSWQDNLFVSPKKENVDRICGGWLPVNMELSHLTKWSFVLLVQLINCCLLTQTEGAPLRIIRPQDQHCTQTPSDKGASGEERRERSHTHTKAGLWKKKQSWIHSELWGLF